MTPVQERAIITGARIALASITNATGAAVAAAWSVSVLDASDEALALYLSRALPAVNAGQRSAASANARSAWRLLGATGANVGPMPTIAPTLVDASTAWMSSPILRLRKHLGDGMEWAEAKASAGGYAQDLSAGDVAAAARQGGDQAAAAYEAAGIPVAWRKVRAPGCCDWCNLVAGQLYSSAEDVPGHVPDKCGVACVTRAHPSFESFTNSRTIFASRLARGR